MQAAESLHDQNSAEGVSVRYLGNARLRLRLTEVPYIEPDKVSPRLHSQLCQMSHGDMAPVAEFRAIAPGDTPPSSSNPTRYLLVKIPP